MKREQRATGAVQQLVSKACAKWSARQRLCRDWLDGKARGDGMASCCNLEAHRQVLRTLDQCKRELRDIANKGITPREP